jgi:hypothetical protein
MDLGEIAGWRRRSIVDGLLIVPPDGIEQGALRVRERQRPLRPLRALLPAGAEIGPLERFTTVEGEHAGLIAFTDGAGGRRAVAMIIGDDSYTLIEGATREPARASWFLELVRTIARFYPLGLGERRRRRYLYQPPPGWQALAHATFVRWLHPEFPRASGRITVHDAESSEPTVPGAVQRFLFVDESSFVEKDAPIKPAAFRTAFGLDGLITRTTGRAADRTARTLIKAVFKDKLYAYVVQLDCRTEQWQEQVPAYVALVRSIEPVPEPTVKESVQQFVHWSE